MNIPSEYLEWRFWVGVIVPGVVVWGVMSVVEQTLLNTLLIFSFVFLVVPKFTRLMARAQTLAMYRAEVLRLQAEFSEVTERVEKLPPDEQEAYAEPLYRMEFRLRVLESVLESRQ